MDIYCVYLTCYRGNLLPPFYIGSSNIEKVKSGYRGSVSSKQYKQIWKSEIENNPHLFKTFIVSTHPNRKSAAERELQIQIKLNVVQSEMYINKSLAKPDGFFGMDVKGENNPMFGYNWGENHPKGMLNKKHSQETINLMKKDPRRSHSGEKNPMFGVKRSEEWKRNRSIMMTGKKRGPYKKTKN